MAITLRNQKGAPLTYTELDANFTSLDSASNRPLNYYAGDSDIDFGSNKILYSNYYINENDLPSASTYHGMFAHVHSTGKGYMAHAGAWIKLHSTGDSLGELSNSIMIDASAKADGKTLKYNSATDKHVYETSASSIATLTDVNMAGLANNKILKYDSDNAKWVMASDQTASGSGIALTDIGVTQTSVGTASLSYNTGNGVFTYTPPDLTSYYDSATFHTKLTTNYALSDFDSATFNTKLTTNYAGIAFDSDQFHTKLTTNYTLGGGGGSGAYDLNGGELTLDADADTTIHSDTDDQIDFKVGGSDVVSIKADGLYVDTVKSLSSGTPTVTSASNINLQTAGSVTITQNSGGGGFRVASLTSSNRGSLSASEGEIIYNTDNGQFEVYQRGAWQPLCKATAVFTLGANGSSDYTFSDPDNLWFPTTTNDPILYLRRGEIYHFVNNSGGSHPFQIRQSNGGSAYSTGVSNNGASSGTITFKIPMEAPNTLYYQCTSHSSMGNTINIS